LAKADFFEELLRNWIPAINSRLDNEFGIFSLKPTTKSGEGGGHNSLSGKRFFEPKAEMGTGMREIEVESDAADGLVVGDEGKMSRRFEE